MVEVLAYQGVYMVNDLVGVKYIKGGRNPLYGLDCWGLVMEVYKRYGIVLPDMQLTLDTCWKQVMVPISVPLVVLISLHPIYLNHAGVFVGRGRILHTTEKTNAVIVHISSLGNRIKGYYKYVQDN